MDEKQQYEIFLEDCEKLLDAKNVTPASNDFSEDARTELLKNSIHFHNLVTTVQQFPLIDDKYCDDKKTIIERILLFVCHNWEQIQEQRSFIALLNAIKEVTDWCITRDNALCMELRESITSLKTFGDLSSIKLKYLELKKTITPLKSLSQKLLHFPMTDYELCAFALCFTQPADILDYLQKLIPENNNLHAKKQQKEILYTCIYTCTDLNFVDRIISVLAQEFSDNILNEAHINDIPLLDLVFFYRNYEVLKKYFLNKIQLQMLKNIRFDTLVYYSEGYHSLRERSLLLEFQFVDDSETDSDLILQLLTAYPISSMEQTIHRLLDVCVHYNFKNLFQQLLLLIPYEQRGEILNQIFYFGDNEVETNLLQTAANRDKTYLAIMLNALPSNDRLTTLKGRFHCLPNNKNLYLFYCPTPAHEEIIQNFFCCPIMDILWRIDTLARKCRQNQDITQLFKVSIPEDFINFIFAQQTAGETLNELFKFLHDKDTFFAFKNILLDSLAGEQFSGLHYGKKVIAYFTQYQYCPGFNIDLLSFSKKETQAPVINVNMHCSIL